MKQEDLLKVIEQQDMKNTQLIHENIRQVITSEFILSNVMLRYLDYIEKINVQNHDACNINDLANKGTPLTKKLVDFDISKHLKDQPMYLHKHTYIEIDYVYKGCCTYYIGDQHHSFPLKEKELCIVNQNVIHGIETHGDDTIVIKCMIPFEYINVEQYSEISQRVVMKNFLNHATLDNVTNPCYIIYRIADSDSVEEMLYHMFCEFIHKEMGWRRAIMNHISNLLLYLMRAKKNELLTCTEMKQDNANITMLMECIRKNYQYITLKDLANDFHFHENYLSRMIKQQCQMSFRELLCQIRLKEAENLLTHTDLSVTEIAERIGYHKPNFFYKLFKEHYHMTPLEFRRERGA